MEEQHEFSTEIAKRVREAQTLEQGAFIVQSAIEGALLDQWHRIDDAVGEGERDVRPFRAAFDIAKAAAEEAAA